MLKRRQKFIKHKIFLVTAFFVSLISCNSISAKEDWGEIVNGLQCRIESEKETYFHDELIQIKAIIKNLSSEEVKITALKETFTTDSNGIYYPDDIHGFWRLEIEEIRGRSFKPGLDAWAPPLKEKDVITLGPGSIFEIVLSLDNWFYTPYKLPIGTYKIYAEYIGWKKEDVKKDLPLNWFGRVASNPIKIQIIPRATNVYIEKLVHKDAIVRRDAAWMLGEIGDAQAVGALIETLKDKSPDVRESAAEALGKIGDRRAVEPLIKLLNDESWGVCLTAVESLGKLGDRRATKPLVDMLKDNLHKEDIYFNIAHTKAIRVLVELEGEQVVGVLIDLLKYYNEPMRGIIIQHIHWLGYDEKTGKRR